ncbi:MAG: type II secretion system protein J [Chthoniobacteraceae bacterium]
MKRHPQTVGSHHAFTLIEVMVSTVLLALLVIVVSQLANSTMGVTAFSRKHLTADAQARVVFDRMAIDFAGMIMRKDVDVICKGIVTTSGSINLDGNTNDAIYFISRAPAFYDSDTLTSAQKSDLALVGYRINTNASSANFGKLERLGKGLTWEGAPSSSAEGNGIAFLTKGSGTSDLTGAPGYLSAYVASTGDASIGTYAGNFADSTDSDFHLLSDGVYRMEYGFVLKSYTDANGTFHTARYSTEPYDTEQGHMAIDGWRDVHAIVVTLAILDHESQKMLPVNASTGSLGATLLASMQKVLPDFSVTATCLNTWQREIASRRFAANSGNISQQAASQVRVYQRCFYLNKK